MTSAKDSAFRGISVTISGLELSMMQTMVESSQRQAFSRALALEKSHASGSIDME